MSETVRYWVHIVYVLGTAVHSWGIYVEPPRGGYAEALELVRNRFVDEDSDPYRDWKNVKSVQIVREGLI